MGTLGICCPGHRSESTPCIVTSWWAKPPWQGRAYLGKDVRVLVGPVRISLPTVPGSKDSS